MCALLDIRGLQIRFGAAAAVRAGQIVETGPSRQLLTNPEHAYTKSLLAAVPTLKTDREKPLATVGA
jgi:ABC-type dipeptide/oligopeptide/nickel transport system ATPase component